MASPTSVLQTCTSNTTATTAENLKLYSKWAVSIYCIPLHIIVDCSFVKLVINRIFARAFTWSLVVAKWIILRGLIGSLSPPKKCRYNIQWTLFFFISSTMSNTGSLLHVGVQIVSSNDRTFLRISGKDCSVKLEIWSVMTDDRP